ncbi:aldehyde dehydrogenase family protein [Pyxidicoccus trucidator]|uniref:aldehyde dehydrogenase family protein n=1 Tax=Pyxidicoccus trucidator TaxID=2709662 RepID=UPI0013DC7AD4|nr:aldehyde dehydrogenase family protein [Pyxidicoccus trucidator]
MQGFDKLYINGEWTPSRGTGHFDVLSASTEEVMGRIPDGTEEDVDRAVKAARAAFDAWSTRPAAERAQVLARLQQGLTARQDDLARTITGEVGMPLALAKPIQVGTPITVTGTYVQLLQEYAFEEQVGNSLVVSEAVGVVACITPWNYPLHQIIAKVAPALAAGCTVVLKPSEVAPLNAFILAEVVHEAGVPAGVFNLVSGTGVVVGEALVRHPEVDMVSFTGSTRAGRRVSELASATIKRVALELGGKSAAIVLDDANLKTTVKRVVSNCFLNSGQTCSAHTRLLVPRSLHEEAARLAAEAAAGFTVGDPFKGEAKLGPLTSEAQRARVREYIQQGLREGATLVAGGPEQPEGLPKGYYVKPTVFAGVTPEMTIAQEEIFGPVLVIMPYEDEDDAIRIANSTIYGLSGAVWSGDVERAKRVARRMRTGQVDINGGRFNPLAPFGGYRQSGHGREFGRHGLEEFLEHKAMQL